jgi:hypothetical protein
MEDNSGAFLENLQELESTTSTLGQQSLAQQSYSFNSSMIKWHIHFSEKMFL